MSICDNCKESEASGAWVGQGCTLCAMRHGLDLLPQWCDRCMAVAQLAHARKLAATIPDLERRAGISAATTTQEGE
jgi:hypothetical protein